MTRTIMSQSNPPDIVINLKNENDYVKNSYSSEDLIEGEVLMLFHDNTIIDSISISFKGRCTSVVTDLHPWARDRPSTKTVHTFLVMQQPIEHHRLPSDSLAKAGSVHSVPFCFTVPAKLLPEACEHGLDPKSPLSQAHQRLPPSLGTPRCSQHVRDLVSENARVEYDILACLKIKSLPGGSFHLIEKAIPVRIEPVFEPNPPLVIEEADPDYRLCAAAGLCWRVLRPSPCDGRLAIRTEQPLPVWIPSGVSSASHSTSTFVTTDLEFRPTQSLGQPPQLESVKIGLRAFTYAASVPLSDSPRPGSHSEPTNLYSTSSKFINLGSHTIGDLVWETCCAGTQSALPGENLEREYDPQRNTRGRRSSQPRTSKNTSHTDDPCGDTLSSSQHVDTCHTRDSSVLMYRTSLRIPINLFGQSTKQKRLVLVPTFNSCLVARNYSLELTYTFGRSSSTTGLSDYPQVAVSGIPSKSRILSTTKRLTLTLPLQITYEHSSGRIESSSHVSEFSTDSRPSRPYTPSDPTLAVQPDHCPLSYTEKAAQTCHLENGWTESPPSYYTTFRLGQNAMRE